MSTVGVDLGGTKTMAVRLVDGEVVARHKLGTPRKGGPDDVLDTIVATVHAVDPDHEAGAVGVGVPGPVRPGAGILSAAPNLPGWDHDVKVGPLLSERLDRPVEVDNDVNVGTLAEHRLGAGRGFDNVLGMFAGTGVGAGLILDGRLRQGPRGLAGEIGHTYVAFRDLLRSDGFGRGELEDYAGRRALERRARYRVEHGADTALFHIAAGKRVKSGVWEKAVQADDALALELIADAVSALAAALASAIALIDVEMIVLGGGLADKLGEPFRAAIATELDERAFAGVTAPIHFAELGDIGGAIGAALLVESVVDNQANGRAMA